MTTRNRRNFRQGVRKERQWGITVGNGSIVAATQVASLLINLTSGLEATLGVSAHNWTVAAMKFDMAWRALAAGTAFDDLVVTAGITWADDDVIAAGTASLPDPSEDNADWIWHSSLHCQWISTSAFSTAGGPHVAKWMIDNQSMRKQRENNSSLVFIARATVLDRTVQGFLGGRALFLLP